VNSQCRVLRLFRFLRLPPYCLWRPDECGITKGRQLIAPLTEGLDKLLATPDQYKALNPANGWGDYDGLLAFVTDYLMACRLYPDADVHVWR
jgi:hypothetical protein